MERPVVRMTKSKLDEMIKNSDVLDRPGFSCPFTPDTNVEWLIEAWPRVKLYLNDQGLESHLDLDQRSIVASKPGKENNLDGTSRAWGLCHLMTKINLHPSLALEIINARRSYRYIHIGTEEFDGLCYLYEIKHDDFVQRRESLIASKKAIYNLTLCTIHVADDVVFAIGDNSFLLDLTKQIVESCIIHGDHPMFLIRNIYFEADISKVEGGEAEQHCEVEQFDKVDQCDVLLDAPCIFSCPIVKETARECERYGQELEECLEKHGIKWELNLDQDRITVSTTTEDPEVTGKARLVLRLLETAGFPPSQAIDIIKGNVQHVIIEMGTEDALCLAFGIDEKKFVERRECLKRSLQEIDSLTQCRTHVTENTAISVGTSDGVEIVRMFVEACIAHGVDPARFRSKIKKAAEISLEGGGMSGSVSSFTESFPKCDEGKLQDALPMVKLALKEHGISCKLNVDEGSMTVSTTEETRDPSASIVKARRLLELARIGLPASLAIELMNGPTKHVFIKIGTQEGGLCSRFGIDQDEFMQRRGRLVAYLEGIAAFVGCRIYVSKDAVAAVGKPEDPFDRLVMVKTFVEAYIVHGHESKIEIVHDVQTTSLSGSA